MGLKNMSIIYEVNLRIEPAIQHEFMSWLYEHIGEMLKLEGFIRAVVYDPQEVEGLLAEEKSDIMLEQTRQVVVHYEMHDKIALKYYLEHYAQSMRADGIAKFPKQFSATRRVLNPLNSFKD